MIEQLWRYPREKMLNWHPATIMMAETVKRSMFAQAAKHLGCDVSEVELYNDIESGDLVGRKR